MEREGSSFQPAQLLVPQYYWNMDYFQYEKFKIQGNSTFRGKFLVLKSVQKPSKTVSVTFSVFLVSKTIISVRCTFQGYADFMDFNRLRTFSVRASVHSYLSVHGTHKSSLNEKTLLPPS